MYVIIIDEIEAICKPRGELHTLTTSVLYNASNVIGKSDQSAAGAAYDSLVNQLLTLMDGLR